MIATHKELDQAHARQSRLIRVGRVTAVYPDRGTARVQFPELSDQQTYELPVLQPLTQRDKVYLLPDEGETVYCLFEPHAPSRGCIVGAIYNRKHLAPFASVDVRGVRFEDATEITYDRVKHLLRFQFRDGSVIEYDAEAKALRFSLEDTLTVETKGRQSFDSLDEILIHAARRIYITSDFKVHLFAPEVLLQGVEVKVVATQFTVEAPLTAITGAVSIIGAVTIVGAVGITGTMTLSGGLNADSVDISGDVNVSGTLGAATLSATTATLGSATVAGVALIPGANNF